MTGTVQQLYAQTSHSRLGRFFPALWFSNRQTAWLRAAVGARHSQRALGGI